MADSTLNRFVSSGTTAERTAFTPDPPTPASGPDPGYIWFDTDDGIVYSWDGMGWVAPAGTGNVNAGGTLTANQLIIGAGSTDVAELGTLGTTTTVLHGNAAGAPTFGAVSLSADVTGDLPFSNLTQIAGLSVLGVTGSSTADVAAITAGTDGHVLKRVSSSSMTFAIPDFAFLAEEICAGSTATVTFSDIPGTYRHLRVLFVGRVTSVGSANHDIYLQFNGDTGTNYYRELTFGVGTTTGSNEQIATATPLAFAAPEASVTAGLSGSGELTIPYYADTSFHKTCFGFNTSKTTNSSNGTLHLSRSIHWASTSAITSIVFGVATSGNFASGSRFSLYGMA